MPASFRFPLLSTPENRPRGRGRVQKVDVASSTTWRWRNFAGAPSRNFTIARNRGTAKLLWWKFRGTGATRPSFHNEPWLRWIHTVFMAVRFISRRFHSGNSVHLQRRFDVPLFFVLVADYVRAVEPGERLWRSIIFHRLRNNPFFSLANSEEIKIALLKRTSFRMGASAFYSNSFRVISFAYI